MFKRLLCVLKNSFNFSGIYFENPIFWHTKICFQFQQVNPVNIGSGNPNTKTVAELSSAKIWKDPALREEPDVNITLAFDFYPIDNDLFHKNGLYGFNQGTKKIIIINFFGPLPRQFNFIRLRK